MKKIKEMFQSPQSRYGTYSMVITAVVIAIVIVINMIAGQLPDSMEKCRFDVVIHSMRLRRRARSF